LSAKWLAKLSLGVQTDAGWTFLSNLELCDFSVPKWVGESELLLCNLRLCDFFVRKWEGERQFLLCNLRLCDFLCANGQAKVSFCCAI
jgi:hypothetical protein